MKPKLLKIALKPQNSFSVRHDCVPTFYNEFHFHPEIEIVQIIQGTGLQIVGNHLHNFKPGDMIMVGANLPHLWKCDTTYSEKKTGLMAESFVIHFLPNAFGDYFFHIPENIQLLKLLNKAKHGLMIKGKTQKIAEPLIKQLIHSNNTDKLILFLQLLNVLSKSRDLVELNKQIVEQQQSTKEAERLNTVMQFLLNNYIETITLHKIASIANLSKNAFCRYFKTATKKSFSSFLLDLRINHACKLLNETNKPISEICFESGFNNFSNFNRYFKQITKCTPLQYRNMYRED
ncbi:MAG: AraC family transcriptional regulator [Chitinophagaceae bacterium]